MRRFTKPLGFVAKATRSSKAETRPVVASTYSSISMSPPPQEDPDQEKEDTEELPKLEELEFIPFPERFGGGFVVKKNTNKTGKNSDHHKSYSGQDNVQGTNCGVKPDYNAGCSGCPGCGDGKGTGDGGGGGGCIGCPGCTRCGCPGCSGGCEFCFGCAACKFFN